MTFKLGDLTAGELNDAITSPSITYNESGLPAATFSHYDLFNEPINNQLAAAPFSAAKGATNGVDLYKIHYSIHNKGAWPDPVTGLLAIPKGLNTTTLPLLSWQHGTVMAPNEGPSSIMVNDQLQRSPEGSVLAGQIRSSETLFNLVRFAGNGYAMAAADYNGIGDSKTAQYYALKEPTNKATTGMLKAAKAVLGRLGISTDSLYLNGWSQGAVNTLWLGEQLRKLNEPVVKQASSSTFSDINKSADYWFNSFEGWPQWGSSVFPLLLAAYENYYNIKGLMKAAIKPQYLPIAEAMQKGLINWDQVPSPKPGEGLLGLPLTGKELLNEQFLDDFNNKRGFFYQRLQENAVTMERRPDHPVRFYGGGLDAIIPPGVSVELPTAFYAPMATGTIVAPTATHRSTFLGSLFGSTQDPNIDIGTWFQQSDGFSAGAA